MTYGEKEEVELEHKKTSSRTLVKHYSNKSLKMVTLGESLTGLSLGLCSSHSWKNTF